MHLACTLNNCNSNSQLFVYCRLHRLLRIHQRWQTLVEFSFHVTPMVWLDFLESATGMADQFLFPCPLHNRLAAILVTGYTRCAMHIPITWQMCISIVLLPISQGPCSAAPSGNSLAGVRLLKPCISHLSGGASSK